MNTSELIEKIASDNSLTKTAAKTIVDGGAGQNTLKVDIPGVPTNDEFTSIQKSVQLLTINDTANITTPVDWLLKDTELYATPQGGSQVDVISTEGATLTNIAASNSGGICVRNVS